VVVVMDPTKAICIMSILSASYKRSPTEKL